MDREIERKKNERRYDKWERLPGGGRRYTRIVVGASRGRAQYVKDVDAWERTIGFAQMIYDGDGRLIEVHEKYPIDQGYRRVRDRDSADHQPQDRS